MSTKQLVFVVAYEAESHLPELFDRMRKAGIEATHDVHLVDDASQDGLV